MSQPMPRGKKLVYFAPPYSEVICDYPFIYMRKAFERAGIEVVDSQLRNHRHVIWVARAMAKLRMLRKLFRASSKAYFVPAVRLAEYLTFPVCYFAESVTFSYDCWPARWDEWEAFFRRHRIRVAFISARRSALEMQKRLPHMHIVWMPEAIDPSYYKHDKPLAERTVDLLELGRKFTEFHEKVREPLAQSGRKHLYEIRRWEMIFKTREQMVDGLEDTKIFVCFPASMTHPAEFAGGVETVTQRYFEAIAARTIPFGHAPAELVDLYGYNPVVEADLNNPVPQIEAILTDLPRYQELVDRNFARLLEVGTWDARVTSMLAVLRERGYAV